MLRRARHSDLAEIAELIEAHPLKLLDLGRDKLAEIVDAAEEHLFVWERDGHFAGYAHFEEAYPQTVMLVNLALTETGNGEGQKLIRAVIDLIFGDFPTHRIFCDTGFDNEEAKRAFLRAGFSFEGVWRECWQRRPKEWVDCHGFSMLRREWALLPPLA